MNEELSYAEMLEIPVETVTVNRREKKRRAKEDIAEQVVDTVNDRVETADPAYAESRPIEREAVPDRRAKRARRILWGEFAAACALCATIFLTNIFMTDSAINTFVRGLWNGTADTADTRTYADFTLSPVVNQFSDVELAVSDTGVLSFTAACSVYAPCEGEVVAVNGDAETGYTVELRHSDLFSTVMSGLTDVYFAEGETVRSNVPLAYTDGTHPVRVTFYEEGSLLDCVTVEGGDACLELSASDSASIPCFWRRGWCPSLRAICSSFSPPPLPRSNTSAPMPWSRAATDLRSIGSSSCRTAPSCRGTSRASADGRSCLCCWRGRSPTR